MTAFALPPQAGASTTELEDPTMTPRNSLILILFLGMTLALGGIAVFVGLRHGSRPSERVEVDPRALERDTEGELRRKEERIAELEAEVLLLTRQVESLQRAPAESARQPVTIEDEPPAVPRGRFSTISETTAQWLRELLPDKFANHTAEELAMLTELDLGGVELTEADLQWLAELTHLRRLSLRGATITDTALALIGDQVESLDLRGSNVTGTGLQHLSGRNLQALSLTNTELNAGDLYNLPPMPQLRTLKLNSIELDDAAIETVGSFRSVRHLEIDSTGLTDTGLRRLLQLNPQLTRIELRGTAVTGEGIEAMRIAYPDCELVDDSGLPYGLFR